MVLVQPQNITHMNSSKKNCVSGSRLGEQKFGLVRLQATVSILLAVFIGIDPVNQFLTIVLKAWECCKRRSPFHQFSVCSAPIGTVPVPPVQDKCICKKKKWSCPAILWPTHTQTINTQTRQRQSQQRAITCTDHYLVAPDKMALYRTKHGRDQLWRQCFLSVRMSRPSVIDCIRTRNQRWIVFQECFIGSNWNSYRFRKVEKHIFIRFKNIVTFKDSVLHIHHIAWIKSLYFRAFFLLSQVGSDWLKSSSPLFWQAGLSQIISSLNSILGAVSCFSLIISSLHGADGASCFAMWCISVTWQWPAVCLDRVQAHGVKVECCWDASTFRATVHANELWPMVIGRLRHQIA